MKWPFEKCVTVSTIHIPQGEYEAIVEDVNTESMPLYGFVDSEESTMFHIPEDMRGDIESDLSKSYPHLLECIEWAWANDCSYIRFSCDGELISRLPVFIW